MTAVGTGLSAIDGAALGEVAAVAMSPAPLRLAPASLALALDSCLSLASLAFVVVGLLAGGVTDVPTDGLVDVPVPGALSVGDVLLFDAVAALCGEVAASAA